MSNRTASIVALVLGLAVAAVLAASVMIAMHTDAPTRASRAAIHAAAAARIDARHTEAAAHDRAYDAAFDPAMVRDRVEWQWQGDAKTLDLTIVNATDGADLTRAARDCARWGHKQTGLRTQCYAFASSEAYDYKNITGDLDAATRKTTAIVNLCWRAMATIEASEETPSTMVDMRDAPQTWEAQQCPESWTGGDA